MSPQYRLAPYPVVVQLVFTEVDWLELCEEHDIKDHTYLDPMHYGVMEAYGSLIVVKFSGALQKLEQHQVANIVAHEMTHVFQALCAYISESNPSHEFMAYTIGDLVEFAMKELECFQSQNCGSTSEQQPSSQLSLEPTSSTTDAPS